MDEVNKEDSNLFSISPVNGNLQLYIYINLLLFKYRHIKIWIEKRYYNRVDM